MTEWRQAGLNLSSILPNLLFANTASFQTEAVADTAHLDMFADADITISPSAHPSREKGTSSIVLWLCSTQLPHYKNSKLPESKPRLLSPAPVIFSSSPPTLEMPSPSAQVTGEQRNHTWWARRDRRVQAELLCGSDFPLVSVSSNHKALILRYIHSGTRAQLCGN